MTTAVSLKSRKRSSKSKSSSTVADEAVPTSPPSPAAAAIASSSNSSTLWESIDFVCSVLGIYVCYLVYAVLQERLTDSKSNDQHMFLMLVQCSINAAAVYPIVFFTSARAIPAKKSSKKQLLPAAVDPSTSSYLHMHAAYVAIAFTYIMGMLSSYWSFAYISYPTSVLVKSCKMVPVMLIGAVVFKKRYTVREYLCVAALTAGIYGFMHFKHEKTPAAMTVTAADGSTSVVEPQGSSLYGVALSVVSLLCDGLTGSQQDQFVATHKPSSYRLMFEINKYAVLELLAATVLTGELQSSVALCLADTSILYDLVVFGAVSAVGQLFIFHMITAFGALALAITTSTRKLATILCSTVLFGHIINVEQWMCVAVVFGALLYDIIGKAAARNSSAGNGKKHKHAA